MLTKKLVIAYFSINNFFRVKKEENRITQFHNIWNQMTNDLDFKDYFNEWDDYLTIEKEKYYITAVYDFLCDEHKQLKERKERKEFEKQKRLAELPISKGADSAREHITYLPHGKYVLTSAQNNTDVNNDMVESLLTFCKENDAKLLVGKLTYNKNGFCQPDISNTHDLWYDPKIKNKIVSGHICIGEKFHFLADANILPTAKNPITGFSGIIQSGEIAILPATKISLKTEAALKGNKIKILLSTGTVTKQNYIMRKIGAVSAIEHNIGAVFIDTEKNEFRHLEQMEGFIGFYDLNKCYSVADSEIIDGHVSALQLGDIHAEKIEDSNLENAIQLIKQLKPLNLVIHDLCDFSSRNHHNIKDCSFLHVQHVNNATVKNDLKSVSKVLDKLASNIFDYNGNVHIVESNHDLAINTWLKNSDFKIDPVNAVTYLSCMLALYKYQEKTGNSNFNMLKWAYKEIGKGKFADKIIFHETDESIMISRIEMGNHGHNGINGSRGSPAQFRNLGVAMNTGHTHSPCITGKVYTAGVTASLEMGYNLGASSWAIAHIVTYENGQRQIIFS